MLGDSDGRADGSDKGLWDSGDGDGINSASDLGGGNNGVCDSYDGNGSGDFMIVKSMVVGDYDRGDSGF